MRDANPYVPSDVENPSMALMHQSHLKVATNLLKDLFNKCSISANNFLLQ